MVSALIPFNKGALVKSVHERCQLLHEQYVAEGLLLSVKADTYMQALLEPYVVSEDDILTDEYGNKQQNWLVQNINEK